MTLWGLRMGFDPREKKNPDLLKTYGIEAWATVPRAVILHKIASDICLEEKLYYGVMLLSWCGPHISEMCVVKDPDGRIVRDAAGNPKPARQKDLRDVLGLGPAHKANLCRAVKALVQKGSLRVDETGRMWPVIKPTVSTRSPGGISTHEFVMLDVVVSTDNLPADSVAKQAIFERLLVVKRNYLEELRELRMRNRELLNRILSDAGIIIKRKKGNKAAEKGEESLCQSLSAAGEQASSSSYSQKKVDDGLASQQATSLMTRASENGAVEGRLPMIGSGPPITDQPQPQIRAFRHRCLEILKNSGLPTPPDMTWWGALYLSIVSRKGHPDHFFERLRKRASQIKSWKLLERLVDDIAGFDDEWTKLHSSGSGEAVEPPASKAAQAYAEKTRKYEERQQQYRHNEEQ